MTIQAEAFNNAKLAYFFTGVPLKRGSIDHRLRELAAQLDFAKSPKTKELAEIFEQILPGTRTYSEHHAPLGTVLHRVSGVPKDSLRDLFSTQPTNLLYDRSGSRVATYRAMEARLLYHGLLFDQESERTLVLHRDGRHNDIFLHTISNASGPGGEVDGKYLPPGTFFIDLPKGLVLYARADS